MTGEIVSITLLRTKYVRNRISLSFQAKMESQDLCFYKFCAAKYPHKMLNTSRV